MLIPHENLLSPKSLRVTPHKPYRVMLVGQCFLDEWIPILQSHASDVVFHRVLFNNWAILPEQESNFDFQVLSIPLRTVLPEFEYMKLDSGDNCEKLFAESCNRLEFTLKSMMKYNIDCGIRSYILNFLTPMQAPLGRLTPRYNLRNPIYFVERLNQYLYDCVNQYSDSYMVDANAISGAIGKRYFQDDMISALNHGGLVANHATHLDASRIEPPTQQITEQFDIDASGFIRTLWDEIVSMNLTVNLTDTVKMVVVDLDDTLWRGIAGETGSLDQMDQVEGWPLGLAEALTFLKKRGIVLAIVSKNEESFIRNLWPTVYEGRLNIDDFAFIRINWRTKAENISEIIKIANILPESVVFIDDNPVERASVSAAIPGIRTLGQNPYLTRSILLWSAETQVRQITEESARRTEMMKLQEIREADKQMMSRSEFLKSLNLNVSLHEIHNVSDAKIGRTLELLNKTNQFNTTGIRWNESEIDDSLRSGTRLFAFYVNDRYTQYGLVGVVFFKNGIFTQFAMSCRVLGMDVEVAVVNEICNLHLQSIGGSGRILGRITHTPVNFPCRDLFQRSGFHDVGDEMWENDFNAFATLPDHVTMVSEKLEMQ